METTENLHFLAVTHNPALIGLIQGFVRQGNYTVDIVATGAQGFKAIIAGRPDLVFLDAALPDIDALSWLGILREMREGKDLSVIAAAEKLGAEDTARFFELGADDCILFRHCDPREFSARMRATLRRHTPAAEREIPALVLGPVGLDSSRHRCLVAGKEIILRPREFELLEMLMRKAGRVLNRPYLLECVWGMASSANTRAVDVTVSRLRKALGPKAAAWVESVDKFGYRFSDPGKIAR